jgi:hypothetical protein
MPGHRSCWLKVSNTNFFHKSDVSINVPACSVADPDPNPDPDPPDPHFFGPPGSGSGYISQRYGSGSFYHSAQIVRKTLISTVLGLLFDFLPLKTDVNVPSKSNMQKNCFSKNLFFVSASGSISQRHGSEECHGSATLPA